MRVSRPSSITESFHLRVLNLSLIHIENAEFETSINVVLGSLP